MAVSFELNAEVRNDAGKGASRRLRRAGKVPAILYGGGQPPQMLALDHNPVMHSLENEAFYSHILNVNIGGTAIRAVLKDLQRHPYKPIIAHLDLQRVSETEKLRMHVPLHFTGEDKAPGVKQAGGVISHLVTEVEVSCLPRHLPEYIEVDVSSLELNATVHLSNLPLPEGVELVALLHGNDLSVASVHIPRVVQEVEAAPTAPAAEAAAAPDAKAAGEGKEGGKGG
jgi:large subunit ribosomal protein L25